MGSGASWATASLVALLGACSAEPPSAASRQLIVDGEESGPEQDGVLLVRAVLEDDTELICTGSLVAPNLLLTAQHCVSYISQGLFSCNTRGELIDNPDGGGQLGLSLAPEALEIYDGSRPRRTPLAHGARIISAHSGNICQNDIAFIVLDTALDLPLLPLRLGRPARLGELGVLVGYGMDAGQRGIDYRTQPRLQKREQEIRGVGPDALEDGVTTVSPRALLLGGPSGCIGDSGGPLLAQSTGAVLGVYSLQISVACNSPRSTHQLVHVPPFQRLIDEAFQAASATPVLEPTEETEAGGAGGARGADATPRGEEGGAAAAEELRASSGCTAASAPRSDGWSWLLLLGLARRRRSAPAVEWIGGLRRRCGGRDGR